MKYDYNSMKKGGKEMRECLDRFVTEFLEIADQIDWEGDEKENFDLKCEDVLRKIHEMGLELSRHPICTADKMLKEDCELVKLYSHV